MTQSMIERALDLYKMDDAEAAQILPFMPTQIGKVKIDWRRVLDCVLIRFAFGMHGTSWAKIPNSSSIRMSFMKAVELGTFDRIAKALPDLEVRQSMWLKVIEGATLAATKRRGRK